MQKQPSEFQLQLHEEKGRLIGQQLMRHRGIGHAHDFEAFRDISLDDVIMRKQHRQLAFAFETGALAKGSTHLPPHGKLHVLVECLPAAACSWPALDDKDSRAGQ
jgi:hypothetical protein